MITTNKYYDTATKTWKNLIKVNGNCYLFDELVPNELESKSYTVSFAVQGEAWVFFHDYFPNFYFHTREELFNTWNNDLYKHNHTNYGLYHDSASYQVVLSTEREMSRPSFNGPIDPIDPAEPFEKQIIYPFFIDVVFRADTDILLEAVNWISTVLDKQADEHDIDDQWKTFTHISVWNSQQHTGRVALKDVFAGLQQETNRKTQGVWNFNDFRNVVRGYGTQFLFDLFNNYNLDPSTIEQKAWYERELLQDKYMIVRFEFDNSSQKQLILHEAGITAIKQMR